MSIRPPKRRRLTAALSTVVVSATLLSPTAIAAAAPFTPPPLQRITPVDVRDVAPATRAEKNEPAPAPAAKFPERGVTEVDPTAKGARGGPVSVSAKNNARIRVEVLDQEATAKARRHGVLVRLDRAERRSAGRPAADADPVSVTLDYSAFAGAYGGDWGQRLRLVRLPECALTTPESTQCQAVELASRNDSRTRTLSAEVDLSAGALVATAAAPSGSAGTYQASDLAPSATWQSGGATGGFTWGYPISTPPTPGGLAPPVSLAYSSSSVDGRTVSTNSQASPVGEGFSFAPGYIERRYKACADDMGAGANNTTATGDQCWETDNATMSLNGTGTELIKDASGRWHGRSEDGSRIERLTGAVNGDNDGEHWKVTTTDGTQYFFGRDQLPGHTAGKPVTNSAWTLPVAGNDSGEPCRQTTFAASFCAQAWRWNLDHVVDRGGNVIVYYYQKDTNRYARNLDGTNAVDYVRGGAVDRIEYGLRAGAEHTVPAPARVRFTMAERCFVAGGCDPAVQANHKNWLDTPMDQLCAAATCPGRVSPTFFTSRRLASISTQIRAGSDYTTVDSWALAHGFRDPKDTTSPVLWLDSITRTGHVGGTATVPPVRFDGVAMNNRADGLEGTPPMNRFRLTNIHTETGGEIGIAYSDRDCVPGTRMPAAEDNNTLRCMPVRWQPDGFAAPVLDWFHTYVVTSVSEFDRTGGAPRVLTGYEYQGTPAWHGDDDDGLVAAKNKTWGQYRGYGAVKTTKGDPGQQPQISLTRYFRGMHGDRLKSGGTRVVQVDGVDDLDAYAGAVRESITYDGAAEVSATVHEPWQSAPTASRTINGTTVHARFTGTAKQVTRVKLDGGRPDRVTTVVNRHDAHGMVDQVSDLGEATTGDEKCTTTTYARNTDDWLMNAAATVEVFALPCGTSPAGEDDVISVERKHYDNQAHGVAPTKGKVTREEEISAWSAAGTHSFVPRTRTEFDGYGRATKITDALGNATTSVYTNDAVGQLRQTETTNPLGHRTVSIVDGARGSLLTETDPNGHRTELAYDALGRLVSVWRPGRAKGTDTPNFAFEYHLKTQTPSVVVTRKLNPAGEQVASYKLLDGLMRTRQTQSVSPLGGRIMSDVFYDGAGRTVLGYEQYYATGDPGGTLGAVVNPAQVERQTTTVYDGAGRVRESVFQPKNTEKWRTSTRYGGDRTYVVPPVGATTTTKITDLENRTVELRQHVGRDTTSAFDATKYVYSRRGDLRQVIDPLGNKWEYTVDIRGRTISTIDPDQGPSSATYDDVDRRTSSTDARGKKLVSTHDLMGRQTGLYEDSTSGPRRASWTYDTATNGKGKLASVNRHVGTATYSTTIGAYTPAGHAESTKVTIPVAEGALAGEYEFAATFNPDGSVGSKSTPELAGELSETLTFGYDKTGAPTTVGSDLPSVPSYVTGSMYNEYGDLLQAKLSAGNGVVYRSFTYETDTGRLSTAKTVRDKVSPNTVSDASFRYDSAGDITAVSDASTGDNQCFAYDHLRRMTEAWTPASADCSPTTRTTGSLGGPAPYWHSWTFDVLGNRRTETRHASSGDTVATSTYGGPRPHAVTEIKTVAPGTTARTDTFGYDAIGNTATRPGQTIEWDAEGKVSKVVEGVKQSTYLYDGDGNRLIARDSKGSTLYLPDGAEVRVDKATGVKTCTRYYTFASIPIAARVGDKVTWLSADRHGTADLGIADGTQSVNRRYSLPFGGARGAIPATWVGDKGFVNGTKDETGLTHLGARQYDPLAGRFLSVDPVIDHDDPQQLNGYAYSNNAPATFSDPDGKLFGWVKKAANHIVENAGRYSSYLGTAALVCSVVPGLQFLAPALGAAAFVLGAIDTVNSCRDGNALDCGLGIAGMVPGGRSLIAAGKGVKTIAASATAAKQASKKTYETFAEKEAKKIARDKARRRTPERAERQSEYDDAKAAHREAQENQRLALANERHNFRTGAVDEPMWSQYGNNVLLGENVLFEQCKYGGSCAGSRHETFGLTPISRGKPGTPSPRPGSAPVSPGTPVANRGSGITSTMVEQKMSYMEKRFGM